MRKKGEFNGNLYPAVIWTARSEISDILFFCLRQLNEGTKPKLCAGVPSAVNRLSAGLNMTESSVKEAGQKKRQWRHGAVLTTERLLRFHSRSFLKCITPTNLFNRCNTL